MTDSQIILGIKTNNPLVWSYICRNLKSPFIATLKRFAPLAALTVDDWEDIFQESCVALMENIKKDKFEERPGSNLFSYFVEIGKRTMMSDVRKKTKHHPKPKVDEELHILSSYGLDLALNQRKTMGKSWNSPQKRSRPNRIISLTGCLTPSQMLASSC